MIGGIDPGKQGGIAVGDKLYKMPINHDGEVDFFMLASILGTNKVKTVYIEKPWIQGMQAGALTIGSNYGIIVAAIQSIRAKKVYVRPKEWQKEIIPGVKGRENIKEATIKWCLDNKVKLPKLGKTNKGKKYHDGCADARCILEYGKRLDKTNE